MHSQWARDTLALTAIAALSLGMLGAGYAIWHSLRERSIDLAVLDAGNLERLTGLALALLGALVIAWLLVLLVLAALLRLAVACGRERRGTALAALLPGFIARLALAGLGGSLVLAGCSAGGTGAPVSVAAPAANPAPRPLRVAPAAPASLAGPEHRPGPVGDTVPASNRHVPEAKAPPGQPAELLSPGFIPHRVPLPLARLAGGPTRASDEVVVRAGDSLWAIAARHLPKDAGTEEVAAAWPRWYAANRRLIGPDPNLLAVGMVLRTPPPDSPAT